MINDNLEKDELAVGGIRTDLVDSSILILKLKMTFAIESSFHLSALDYIKLSVLKSECAFTQFNTKRMDVKWSRIALKKVNSRKTSIFICILVERKPSPILKIK